VELSITTLAALGLQNSMKAKSLPSGRRTGVNRGKGEGGEREGRGRDKRGGGVRGKEVGGIDVRKKEEIGER
jgi:hypothetical protein